MREPEPNPLKATLGEFMEQIVSGEELDPDRVIAAGRGRLRRRRTGAVLGGTLLVLAVAGSVYALRPGDGAATSPATGTSRTHAAVTPSSVATPPPGTLPGTVVGSGRTDGVSWEISGRLDGYSNGDTTPQFCVYVWTSTGMTDPAQCMGPVQTDPPDPAAPDKNMPRVGQSTIGFSKTLGLIVNYTSNITEMRYSYTGGSFSFAPVDLGKQVEVSAVLLPVSGGTESGSGPGGVYGPVSIDFMPPVTPSGY